MQPILREFANLSVLCLQHRDVNVQSPPGQGDRDSFEGLHVGTSGFSAVLTGLCMRSAEIVHNANIRTHMPQFVTVLRLHLPSTSKIVVLFFAPFLKSLGKLTLRFNPRTKEQNETTITMHATHRLEITPSLCCSKAPSRPSSWRSAG